MAAVTIEDLENASFDVASIGEFVNGDSSTVVTTRSGRQFPSLAKYIFDRQGWGMFSFAFNASDTDNSLAHTQEALVGHFYLVGSFGTNGRGTAVWKCFATQSGSPTVGQVSFDDTRGIVLEGSDFRFLLIVEREIDPAMIGATADARSSGQPELWEIVRQFAAEFRTVVRPSSATGFITTTGLTFDYIRDIDGANVEFLEQSGGYDGVLVDMTFTDYKITEPKSSVLRAKGINQGPNTGESNWQGTQSLATGFVLNDDNGGNSVRHFHANRLRTGVVVKGNTEKNIFHIHGSYNHLLCRGDTTEGSPDTIQLHLSGTNNTQAFVPDDGDTSYQLYLNTEGRIDPGIDVSCYWNPAVTRPQAYIELKNGKHIKLVGRHRGHNGRLLLTDDRFYERGADTVEFDFGTIHTYGIVYSSYRVQHLKGRLSIHDSLNGRANSGASDTTGGTIDCPAVWLRQVDDASGFKLEVEAVTNRECVRWGDAALGLRSVNAHMGTYRGDMLSFTDPSGFDPKNGKFVTSKTFLHIESAENCFADIAVHGNVIASSGSIKNRITMPNGADWVRNGYSATDESGAPLPAGRLLLELQGTISLDDIFWRPWLFDGLSASIEELGGKVVRSAGSWSIASAPSVTSNELESATHWTNTKVKRAGAQVFCNGRPLYAAGPAVTDAWLDSSGSTVVSSASIVEQAATGAFATRVSSAGSSLGAGALRQAYDRLYYDLAGSGVLSKLVVLYLFGTQDIATAKLNLISGLAAGPYNGTAHGALSFVANRYLKGNGVDAYLATGYDPSAQAEGMGLADMHIGIFSVGAGSDAGYDAGTVANNRLRIGGTDTGLIYSTSASDTVSSFQNGIGSAPHHLVASRRASPVGGRAYRNGKYLGVDGIAPSGSFMPTAINVFRQGSPTQIYSAESLAAFHVGLDLTDAQVAALYQALRKFLQQTGAVK